ncbi:MAG: sugar phosphate isomerase/epimerase family protein [Isosphaeraceae bacterium]
MSARIGLDHYTIAHRGLSPRETLAWARARRLDGVQFLEPLAIDASLDSARLADLRAEADALGLYLEVGLPSPSPVRRSRERGGPVSPGEHATYLARQVEAIATLGCGHARAYVGDRHDRFRRDPPWTEQLRATRDTLQRLTPSLLDLGVKVAIETHADLTSGELLELLDTLHPDAFGVTLDTGNLAMRLDEPLRAVERLAPRVLCTHVKDCVVATSPRGLRWQARPVGAGILPIASMIDRLLQANPALNLSIELHPRIYDLPWKEPGWLDHFPAESSRALEGILDLARLTDSRMQAGLLEPMDLIESIPWAERDLPWIEHSAAYLRGVVEGRAIVRRVTKPD